jgi:hypothetical protein
MPPTTIDGSECNRQVTESGEKYELMPSIPYLQLLEKVDTPIDH